MNSSGLSLLSASKSASSSHRRIDPIVVVRDARRCLGDPKLRDQALFIDMLDSLDCESSGISLKLRREVAILKRLLTDSTPTPQASHDNARRVLDF